MTASRKKGRTLRGYLLLPRPKDAVKWWIAPATFALGVLAARGVSGDHLARAAVTFAVLELLLYQARYQWNDIRGFRADQAHPDAAERGRLPGPVDRARAHIGASAAVAALRIAAAAAVVLAFPGLRLAVPVAVLAAGVFGVAAAYEALRGRATGRTGDVPAPLRPAIVALWLVVGGGYAIRGLAGLALALPLGARPGLAIAAGVAMWAFGVAFVTARWAVEALAFARLDGTRVVWSVDAAHEREHMTALVRWLPREVPEATAARGRAAGWAPLRAATPPTAPWNVAGLIAAGAAGAAGPLLVGARGSVAIGAAGALLALAALRAPRITPLVALCAAGIALVAPLAVVGTARPLLAALPWLSVVALELRFRAQTLDSMGVPLARRWRRAAGVMGTRAVPGHAVRT